MVSERTRIVEFKKRKSFMLKEAATLMANSDLPCCAVARVINQCCFNSTPDPFNGQTANFLLKPPKVIELVLKKPI